MPHQIHLRTLGRTGDHRLSMLRNLTVSVLRYERVKTTEAKAKEVRRLVDRVVRLGQDGSLASRRRALALTRDPLIVEKVFTDLRERFADRTSGFVRLAHLGHRVGDGAPMALVELIEGAPAQAKPETPEAAEERPGGVRGIARRLRGPRREEPEREEKAADEKPAEKAEAKREKPKAKKTTAKKPAVKERAPGKRAQLAERKTEASKTKKSKPKKKEKE